MIEQRSGFIEAVQEHFEAIRARDAARFAKTLRPDVRLVGPHGTMISGFEEAVAAHRAWFSERDWTFAPTILWSQTNGPTGWALTDVMRTIVSSTRKRVFDRFAHHEKTVTRLFFQAFPVEHLHQSVV